MDVRALRALARERGVTAGRLKKIELVRAIQRQGGNFDCFAKACAGYCDQWSCLWRDDCLALSTQKHPDR